MKRDITIKRCIADFGPLTRQQLEALAEREEDLGSPKKLYRRLLPSKPLLTSKQIHVWRGRRGVVSDKYVYADYDISKRKDFEHDLITTWVHIILYKFFDLHYWKRNIEKRKGELNQDAYFILGIPGAVVKDETDKERPGESHYYLESDTGSEGYAQIEEKLKRYVAYYERTKKSFAVLFVCLDNKRAVELAKRASRIVPNASRFFYLFTDLQTFLDAPTGGICRMPYEEDLFTILPPV